MQVRAIVGGEAGLGQGPVLHGSAQPPGGLMGPQANGPVMTSGHDPGLGPQQSNGGQGGGGGGGKQSNGKKTSTSRNNGYRAKELAEIKNGLQQFEKKAEAGRAAETRDSLRTVSSLSTESSTNSVCSDTGFSSVQEALLKLSNLGYDEASAMRAVSMGDGTFNTALDLIQKQPDQINGVNGFVGSNHAAELTAVARKSSADTARDYGNLARVSPGSSTANMAAVAGSLARVSPGLQQARCDSPQTSAPAPALPPRSVHGAAEPVAGRQCSPATDAPPPLPPPRGAHTRPPTPPRGATPPPPLPPHNQQLGGGHQHLNGHTHPLLLKRMSPVPSGAGRGGQVAAVMVTRGQSPVTQQQLPSVAAQQQQVAHQLQALSIFSSDNQVEPPPPYPMGTLASPAPAPPSYSQTLAMRQSPTLSSTSSTDYRRSPLLQSGYYPNVMMVAGHGLVSATPPSPAPNMAPSPVNSLLSGSSRSSWSSAAWSARQAKTHSPIIMQSVKSTQVQKPVLQQACGPPPSHSPESPAPPPLQARQPAPPPPPSYADSIQKKSSALPGPSPSPVPSAAPPPLHPAASPVPTTCPPSYSASIQAKQGPAPAPAQLPPPPPYPSTAVQCKPEPQQLHPDSLVSAAPLTRGSPLINTAKVVGVAASNANLKQPPRKYSPHLSETSSATSRSASPVSGASECPTVSASPVPGDPASTQDSGICFPGESAGPDMAPPPPPPYKTVHHTSPKPERKTYSREQDEIRNESKIKKYPPQAFKFYMEQHVENVIKYYDDRRKRRMQLEQEMVRFGLEEKNQELYRKVLSQKESNYIRLKRAKINKRDFKKIKTIGLGAFGEVSLVKKVDGPMNHNGYLYAMKTLKKSEVLMRNQVAHVKAERDILAEADNEWIVKLYHSFQDKNNLYFVMDYIPGGDLMSLLIKKGIFEEPLAKFYVSELVCAVDSVHKMGFIHRDIKPDNILIDSNGHIKLTDFGLCTGFRWTHNSKYYQHNINGHSRQDSMDPGNLDLDSGRCSCPSYNGQKLLERRKEREHARCIAHSLVGTPNYIAPEVLERKGYSQLCDWWSVGVILYEMLVGQPPFLANNPAETQLKVIHWYESLHIPRNAGLSRESQSFIRSLCTSEQQRLGRNGSDEIKNHDFFKGIDFSCDLRKKPAPHKPNIKFPEDTSNFDPIDPDKLRPDEEIINDEDNNSFYHGFYEFTFRRFFDDAGHPVFSPGPNAMRAMQMRPVDIDDNENPSGPVYV